MTDWIELIKEKNPEYKSMNHWGLPEDMETLIRQSMNNYKIKAFRECYINSSNITPEAEAELRDLLKIWDSPLMKALA